MHIQYQISIIFIFTCKSSDKLNFKNGLSSINVEIKLRSLRIKTFNLCILLIKNKYLIYNNYRIKCAVGKRGIRKKKEEGDFITPIGLYKINYILYRKDRLRN